MHFTRIFNAARWNKFIQSCGLLWCQPQQMYIMYMYSTCISSEGGACLDQTYQAICEAARSRRLTHGSMRHIGKKTTSRNTLASNVRQFGSGTSNVANAAISHSQMTFEISLLTILVPFTSSLPTTMECTPHGGRLPANRGGGTSVWCCFGEVKPSISCRIWR